MGTWWWNTPSGRAQPLAARKIARAHASCCDHDHLGVSVRPRKPPARAHGACRPSPNPNPKPRKKKNLSGGQDRPLTPQGVYKYKNKTRSGRQRSALIHKGGLRWLSTAQMPSEVGNYSPKPKFAEQGAKQAPSSQFAERLGAGSELQAAPAARGFVGWVYVRRREGFLRPVSLTQRDEAQRTEGSGGRTPPQKKRLLLSTLKKSAVQLFNA